VGAGSGDSAERRNGEHPDFEDGDCDGAGAVAAGNRPGEAGREIEADGHCAFGRTDYFYDFESAGTADAGAALNGLFERTRFR